MKDNSGGVFDMVNSNLISVESSLFDFNYGVSSPALEINSN